MPFAEQARKERPFGRTPLRSETPRENNSLRLTLPTHHTLHLNQHPHTSLFQSHGSKACSLRTNVREARQRQRGVFESASWPIEYSLPIHSISSERNPRFAVRKVSVYCFRDVKTSFSRSSFGVCRCKSSAHHSVGSLAVRCWDDDQGLVILRHFLPALTSSLCFMESVDHYRSLYSYRGIFEA